MALKLCRRLLRDDALAEDAVQEASLQALLHITRLHKRAGLAPGWQESRSTCAAIVGAAVIAQEAKTQWTTPSTK
jgi:hypothetical protein